MWLAGFLPSTVFIGLMSLSPYENNGNLDPLFPHIQTSGGSTPHPSQDARWHFLKVWVPGKCNVILSLESWGPHAWHTYHHAVHQKNHVVQTTLLPLQELHPWRLKWNIIMEVWKIIFLSKCVICRFHVNLPGCNDTFLHSLLPQPISFVRKYGLVRCFAEC